MLIKLFKTPLPLNLEEYRIAQLYTVQKVSQEESQGTNNRVEFVENEPYEGGFGGSGQFTLKLFYLYERVPSWARMIVKKDSCVTEKAWNAYPKCLTKYSCSLFESASVEIITEYHEDNGSMDKIFNMEELKKEGVVLEPELIDISKNEYVTSDSKDYVDLRKFVSEKNGDVFLAEDWLSTSKKIICSYKLIKIHIPVVGLGSKIENYVMKQMATKMTEVHIKMWTLQDEWAGMTIDDIRKLEEIAKEKLKQK